MNIRELLDRGKPPRKRPYELAVRVNSIASDMIKDDMSVILTGKNLPNTIYFPKVECEEHLKLVKNDFALFEITKI